MTPHMQTLGWTLLHFVWQASVIAALYKLVDLGLSRSTSHVRYLLSLTALLAMFAAATATLFYEEQRIQNEPAATLGLNDTFIAPYLHLNNAYPINETSATTTAPASLKSRLQAKAAAILPAPALLLKSLDALWLLGVFALTLRTIGGWWLIQRLRHSALQPVPAELAARFARLSQRIGLKRPVNLRLSQSINGPLALGMVRSLILLPVSALTALTPDQLEAVLAHELAHIRRADYLWNILQTVVETLFFFHPAVWWIGANLRRQRELCCDDLAIDSCADPITYATALLLLEEQRAQQAASHIHLNPALAQSLDGHQSVSTLRSRIARILGDPAMSDHNPAPRSLAPFSLLGVCAALFVFLVPLPQLFASIHPSARVKAIQSAIAALAKPAPTTVARLSALAKPAPAPALVAPAPRAELSFDYNHQLAQPAADIAAQATARTAQANASTARTNYIDAMKAAGYDVDLDKLVALKIQGVTPEFAQSIAQSGLGKPTADELIALKIHGADAAYIQRMKAYGLAAASYKDIIADRIFRITPEYLDQMKAAGFSDLSRKKLLDLRVQNITPEYVQDLRKQFPGITPDEAVRFHIFKVTPEFASQMKAAGFADLSSNTLVELRIQNITPEYVQDVRKQFPGVTPEQVVKLRIFAIDSAFIAAAKFHGFNDLTAEKLIKLRISGILDDEAPRTDHRRDASRVETRIDTQMNTRLDTRNNARTLTRTLTITPANTLKSLATPRAE